MKRFNPILTGCIAGVLMLTGCDDFLNINEDPNNPTEAPISALTVNSTFESARNTQRVGVVTSRYVQYTASPNSGNSTDIMEPLSFGTAWSNLYNTMSDLQDIRVEAEETNSPHYTGLAKTLIAYNLSLVVNMFGGAPYDEAFFAETFTPSYNTDEELYDRIFQLLDEAEDAFMADESTFTPGSDDLVHGGDLDAWIRTINALRARILNHYSNLGEYDPGAVLDALDVAYTSNDHNAYVSFYDTQINPWAQIARNNASLIISNWYTDYLMDSMNGTRFGIFDPRLPLISGDNDDGEYIGVRSGAGRGGASESGDRSVMTEANFYSSPEGPLFLLSYPEMKFIEAEAAYRNGDSGRAYDAYMDGIRMHMEKLGVEEADIDEYLADDSVDVGEADLNLEHIFMQKYLAMVLHPESWVDARRFDYAYPDFQEPAGLTQPELIRRVRYPNQEQERNSANVPSVTLLDRIFWDN